MIFPNPENIKSFERHQITWTLIFANIFLFVLIFSVEQKKLTKNEFYSDENLLVAGGLYREFLNNLNDGDKKQMPRWLLELPRQTPDQLQILGNFAVRDSRFLEKAAAYEGIGDTVAIKQWQQALSDHKNKMSESPSAIYGLSSQTKDSLAWLTYQFSHGGWLHLFSNMIFLLFVGSAVEALAGGSTLLLIYLFGGIAGGYFFLYANPFGTTPMVGASASVSALLAFYAVFERRKRVRYFYFLSPLPLSNGFIYLPTLLMIPLYLISDFASALSGLEGYSSGIAYMAHIGGSVFGIMLGIILRFGFPKHYLPNEI